MKYKVTFFDSFDDELGYKLFNSHYYNTGTSVRNEVVKMVNEAQVDSLIPVHGGAIKKANINSFTVREVSDNG